MAAPDPVPQGKTREEIAVELADIKDLVNDALDKLNDVLEKLRKK